MTRNNPNVHQKQDRLKNIDIACSWLSNEGTNYWDMDNLKNVRLSKRTRNRHKRVHIVWFHFCEILEKVNQIFSVRKQISSCLGPGIGAGDDRMRQGRLTAKRNSRTFCSSGNVLHLFVMGTTCIDVCQKSYKLCILKVSTFYCM